MVGGIGSEADSPGAIFNIDIYAYAVVSNHYHAIPRVDCRHQ